jgi:outer membrane protein OmpA-like peptidoglycan-associated protein
MPGHSHHRAKILRCYFSGFFLFIIFAGCYGQDTHGPKNFWEASNLIIEESLPVTIVPKKGPIDIVSQNSVKPVSFEHALEYWKKALKSDTTSANLNYKVGLCYFFSYDNQLEALPYFRKAIRNLGENCDFNNPEEKRAPFTTYYFLATTLLESGQPDSAVNYYRLYQDNFQEVPISYGRCMAMSLNASEAMRKPAKMKVTPFGNGINTHYAETDPVLRRDNKILFYCSRKPSEREKDTNGLRVLDANIYYCEKNENGEWGAPQAFPHNSAEDEAPLFINQTGDVLYFRRTHKTNADIYKTTFQNNRWSEPEPVKEVNSPHHEAGICLSSDEKHMYFSSDRNAKGRFDIYVTKLKSDGTWEKPEVLHAHINGPYDELDPHLSPDDKILYYASNGSSKKGLGSFDIYYCTLQDDDTWSEPVNIGYPVSNTRSDLNFYQGANNLKLYASLTASNSYDIFQIDEIKPEIAKNPATATISATVAENTIANSGAPVTPTTTQKTGQPEVRSAESVEKGGQALADAIYGMTGENNNPGVKVESNPNIPLEVVQPGDTSTNFKVVRPAEPGTTGLNNTIQPIGKNEKKHASANAASKSKSKSKSEKGKSAESGNENSSSPAVSVPRSSGSTGGAMAVNNCDPREAVENFTGGDVKKNERLMVKVLYYESNRNKLTSESRTQLVALVKIMNQNPEFNAEIIGHSDITGSWAFNNELSNLRAKMVHDYFVANGISGDRIFFYGRGSASPLYSNETAEGKARNRRVEIILTK